MDASAVSAPAGVAGGIGPADRGEFPCLDGIRAVAALLVLVNHFDQGAELADPGYLPHGIQAWVERFGNFGVAVFFVLSGFLLFRPFVAARLAEHPFPRLGGYYLRRFVRIFPAYWLVLFVYVYVLDRAQIHSLVDGVAFFGLVQNYKFGYIPLGLFTAWTLVIEVSFYVVLPGLAWLLHHLARAASTIRPTYLAGCAVLIAVGIAARGFGLWVASPTPASLGQWFRLDYVDQWLLGYIDWFALGMMIAVASIRWPGPTAWWRVGIDWLCRHTWAPWLLSVLVYWWVVQLHIPRLEFIGFTHLQTFGRGILLPIAAGFLLLPLVFGDQRRGWGRHVLATRGMRTLGLLSYGIYLWHVPVIRELERWAGPGQVLHQPAVRLVVAVVGTVALAACTYVIVERPLMRWARSVARRGAHA